MVVVVGLPSHWIKHVSSTHLLQLLHPAAQRVRLQALLALLGLQLRHRLLLLGAVVLHLLARLPGRPQLLLQRRHPLLLLATHREHSVRVETALQGHTVFPATGGGKSVSEGKSSGLRGGTRDTPLEASTLVVSNLFRIFF